MIFLTIFVPLRAKQANIMDKRKIYYLLHSGKNNNLKYYIRSYLHELTPRWFTRWQASRILEELNKREDRDDILRRVAYYNRLTADSPIDESRWLSEAIKVKDQPMTGQSSYYHDAMEIARYFSTEYKWVLVPGDTIHDSIEVPIPICQKRYEDSLYTAWVSGYEPALDSINLRLPTITKTVTITSTIYKEPLFTFGLQAGAGYGIINRKPDVYLGIGGTMRLWRSKHK